VLEGARVLVLLLALLPGAVTVPAVAGAAPAPGTAAPEIAKQLTDVASKDPAVQEAAAMALGKTGNRKILPLLEALREGSVYVHVSRGNRGPVRVGERVTEGGRPPVPLFSASAREPVTGADGKPLLVELSALEEV